MPDSLRGLNAQALGMYYQIDDAAHLREKDTNF